MRKSEFVAAVAKEAGMSQRDTEKVIDALNPVIARPVLRTVTKSAYLSESSNRKSTLLKQARTR